MKVQFKNPGQTLTLRGGTTVTDANLTPELYRKIINLSPSSDRLFKVTEEETDETEDTDTTKQTTNGTRKRNSAKPQE